MTGPSLPPGRTSASWPAERTTLFLPGTVTFPRPSSSITFIAPVLVAETISVVPSTAADAALVRIVPPPRPDGEWKRIEPFCNSISRELGSNEKSVFEPTRVTVWSGEIISAREFAPVRMTSGERNSSVICARRVVRVERSMMLTSFTSSVIFARSSGTARAESERSARKAVKKCAMVSSMDRECSAMMCVGHNFVKDG